MLLMLPLRAIIYTTIHGLTRPVILHFNAENSRLKVKKHCKGLDTIKCADKETILSNKQ